jgi:citrate synthase
MSDNTVYVRGLKNVAACQTRVSFVDPLGALYYRGYDIDRLVGRVCFEEVIHLLLYHKLPNQSELANIRSLLISEMSLPKQVITCIKNGHKSSHPMESIRTAISRLGEYDSNRADNSETANKQRALKLIAKVPTIVASFHRIQSKQDLISPKKEYGFAENFLYLFRGKPADVEEKDALDRFMILHADHGLNASTFAARVTGNCMGELAKG